jgi:hypothetical protein
MAPVAAAVFATAAAAAFLGVVAGAIAGIVVWRLRWGLLAGALAVVGIYVLLAIVLLGSFWLRFSLFFGMPPLLQASLLSWTIALQLETRTKLRPLWTALLALGCSMAIGMLCLLTGRLNLYAPIWLALGIVACIMVLAVWQRKPASR